MYLLKDVRCQMLLFLNKRAGKYRQLHGCTCLCTGIPSFFSLSHMSRFATGGTSFGEKSERAIQSPALFFSFVHFFLHCRLILHYRVLFQRIAWGFSVIFRVVSFFCISFFFFARSCDKCRERMVFFEVASHFYSVVEEQLVII